ncbi:MAG: oxidase [Bacteroidota bacterium]
MNDILKDASGDLLVEDGDFVVGESDLQHQQDILLAHKGEFKESPELGVGIAEEQLNENPRQILNQIRRNFEYDGMVVNNVSIASSGNIVVDAYYNSN